MRWPRHIALAALAACTACESRLAPVAPDAAPGNGQTGHTPGRMTMESINLYLHEAAPSPGVAARPTFSVHAEQFTLLDNAVWSFEDARAVIYGAGPQEGEITLEAARGRFEEDRGALLEGGVRAYVAELLMELSDIEWVNPQNEEEEGVARSGHAVRVSSPALNLSASSLRLYPERKVFFLTDVSGLVRFERSPE